MSISRLALLSLLALGGMTAFAVYNKKKKYNKNRNSLQNKAKQLLEDFKNFQGKSDVEKQKFALKTGAAVEKLRREIDAFQQSSKTNFITSHLFYKNENVNNIRSTLDQIQLNNFIVIHDLTPKSSWKIIRWIQTVRNYFKNDHIFAIMSVSVLVITVATRWLFPGFSEYANMAMDATVYKYLPQNVQNTLKSIRTQSGGEIDYAALLQTLLVLPGSLLGKTEVYLTCMRQDLSSQMENIFNRGVSSVSSSKSFRLIQNDVVSLFDQTKARIGTGIMYECGIIKPHSINFTGAFNRTLPDNDTVFYKNKLMTAMIAKLEELANKQPQVPTAMKVKKITLRHFTNNPATPFKTEDIFTAGVHNANAFKPTQMTIFCHVDVVVS